MKNIQIVSITTAKGNIIQLFHNNETGLVVVDITAENEEGGNEILRMKIDEDAMLSHCKPKPKRRKGIIASDKSGSHRTGGLSNMTAALITSVLGFSPNVKDDPYKVENSWGFTCDGKQCGIWDYKGSHLSGKFSTYGPDEVFEVLFPGYYSKQ